MKIAFVIYSLTSGGAERATINRANYFSETKRWDVTIITFAGKDLDFYSVLPSVKRVTLNLPCDKGDSASFSVYIKRIIKLRKVLLDLKPDILISEMPAANLVSIIACFGLQVKVVIEERIHPPMLPLCKSREILRKYLYPFASARIVLTKKSAEWFKEELGCDAFVIPNSVVYPLSKNEPILECDKLINEKRKIILSVGRLEYQKGFDRLIESFSKIANDLLDWDLVILGDGPERKNLEFLIDKLGIKGRVFLPGKAGNISDWYKRADIFVLSSRFEGFPNVLVEAMSYGCPVISFDCDTGPSEIIRNGIDGILVPQDDIEAFTSALKELALDEKKRKNFSAKAIEVRERFSIEKIAHQWENLFNELLG